MSLFGLEKEMSPIIREWAEDNFDIVKSEVGTPEGVPDFIFANFSKANIDKRLAQGITEHLSNDTQISIWALVTSKPNGLSKKQLQRLFLNYISESELDHELGKLKDKNFIEFSEGVYTSECDWFPHVKCLVSVELKLSNFKEALTQAIRYSNYSDFSYIGFPEDKATHINNSKHLQKLKEENIGLLSVNNSGVQILFKPQNNKITGSINHSTRIKISELLYKEYLKS